MLYLIVVVFCAGFLTNCAFVAAGAAAARYFGVHVTKAQIGWFPIFRRGRLHFGLIPMGCFIRFAHSSEDADSIDGSALFDRKPRWMRVILSLVGVAGMFLLAFALRGIDAWHSFAHGFGQFIEGTLAPVERGADLLRGYALVAEDLGAVVAVSVFAAKTAAINLLPVPTFAGGQALLELLGITGPGPAADRRLKVLAHISVYLLLAVGCLWIRALVEAMRH